MRAVGIVCFHVFSLYIFVILITAARFFRNSADKQVRSVAPEGTGTTYHFFKTGEYYTIPYRCLCPEKIENLLVAGRCISSTHEAQASYRIMPTVCALGQAAGVGAAVAYKQKSNVSDADIKKIREILIKNKAVID